MHALTAERRQPGTCAEGDVHGIAVFVRRPRDVRYGSPLAGREPPLLPAGAPTRAAPRALHRRGGDADELELLADASCAASASAATSASANAACRPGSVRSIPCVCAADGICVSGGFQDVGLRCCGRHATTDLHVRATPAMLVRPAHLDSRNSMTRDGSCQSPAEKRPSVRPRGEVCACGGPLRARLRRAARRVHVARGRSTRAAAVRRVCVAPATRRVCVASGGLLPVWRGRFGARRRR